MEQDTPALLESIERKLGLLDSILRDAREEIAWWRALARVRKCFFLREHSLGVTMQVPRWLAWAFPLRSGTQIWIRERTELGVDGSRSNPNPRTRARWGWRLRHEPGRDAYTMMPLWVWWFVQWAPRLRFLRFCYRHGVLQGPENADYAQCRWRFAFTWKPYAWMPRRNHGR